MSSSNMKTNGTHCANVLCDILIERQCDYTLLFFLRNPHVIENTDLGKQLSTLLDEHQLTLTDFQYSRSRSFYLQEFFTVVRTRFNTMGIAPIAPRNYIIDKNKGGKERILLKYQEQTHWPVPRNPYCIQTMGTGAVLFMVFQTWQDALIKQIELLTHGYQMHEHSLVPISQVYEHQWWGNSVRLMIDWEILASQYEDRLPLDQIKLIPDKFPEWLVSRLRETRALPMEAEIECIVKDKTRPKGSDLKLSKHFIFNIEGVTLEGHLQALTQCIQPWRSRIEQTHRDKTLKCIDDKDLDHPAWGWDHRLLRGQNGIGTLFGTKKGEGQAPLPTLQHKIIIKPGKCQVQKFSWSDKIHSIPVLGQTDSLKALYFTSYTTPWATMVSYDPVFLRQIQEVTPKNRT
jgi:hypothetical protein